MAIHKILENEILKEIKDAGQSKIVGERIVSWLKELSEGIVSNRHTKDWIALILKDIKVKDHNED